MSKIKDFTKLYETGGAACWCVKYLTVKYNKAGGNLTEAERADVLRKMNRKYRRKAEKAIREACDTDFSSLCAEIEQDIKACGSEWEKENYCDDLLHPFGFNNGFIDTVLPIGTLNNIERNISILQNDKIQIQGEAPLTDKKKQEEIKACEKMIARCEADKKKAQDRCRFFFDTFLTGSKKDGSLPIYGVECMYRRFVLLFHRFADAVDWALMRNGIDLLALQERSGIYLKARRSAWDFAPAFAGSVEIAKKVIQRVRPAQNDKETDAANETQPQGGRGEKPQPHFVCSLTDEQLARIFNGLKQGSFIASDSVLSDWLYICNGGAERTATAKITWRAKNSRTREPSKKSLLDLLVLMGVEENDIRANINQCFKVEDAIKYTSKDYTKYRDWRKDIRSEYHTELSDIIKNSKQEQK